MTVELSLCILAAFAVDLILGDPRWMPHPVRLIGLAAVVLERALVALLGRTRLAGVVFILLIVGGSAAGAWGVLRAADRWSHRAYLGVSVFLLYTSFAARDLHVEGRRVARALEGDDLARARKDLSMIVGRDTEHLDETEIVRATVETVAENTVDGVISPLFFAALGGAPAAIAFKAASTLDSMVGHLTPRYRAFGWASARLDDAANWLPARIGALLFVGASWLTRHDARGCWRAARRDGRKSPSPNAGISEAAVAGALGVRLGGVNRYDGEEHARPYVGDAARPLERRDISRSISLMYACSFLALVFFVGVRVLLCTLEPWKPSS